MLTCGQEQFEQRVCQFWIGRGTRQSTELHSASERCVHMVVFGTGRASVVCKMVMCWCMCAC